MSINYSHEKPVHVSSYLRFVRGQVQHVRSHYRSNRNR